MSLNYTTLQSQCLTLAKRSNLTSEIVVAVAMAEAMIRRDLLGYELQATLQESDRSSSGVYNAPSYVHYVQAVWTTDADGDEYALNRVGLGNIKRLSSSSNPLEFAHYQDFIEFRGVPATDKEFTVHYIGHPAPLTTTATNNLLTDHEDIYCNAALFNLYAHDIEDFDTAQTKLDAYTAAVNALNTKIRRKMGGGIRAAGYNLMNHRNQRGY